MSAVEEAYHALYCKQGAAYDLTLLQLSASAPSSTTLFGLPVYIRGSLLVPDRKKPIIPYSRNRSARLQKKMQKRIDAMYPDIPGCYSLPGPDGKPCAFVMHPSFYQRVMRECLPYLRADAPKPAPPPPRLSAYDILRHDRNARLGPELDAISKQLDEMLNRSFFGPSVLDKRSF